MRPSDVDALLRALLPALSIAVAGCTGTDVAKSSTGAAAPASSGGEAGEATPADEGADSGKSADEGDDAPAARLDVGPAVPPPDMRMNYPACPTVTWCAPQAATMQVAVDAKKLVDGCPAEVTSEQSLVPSAEAKKGKSLIDDPVYSQLFLRSRVGPVGLDVEGTKKTQEAGEADACCYSWTTPCPGGRPFLDAESRPMVAPLQPGPGWAEAELEGLGEAQAREEAARQWLADAAMEHASVASFARTTLELMALGAPADLIARTQQASLDEIEHAKTCLAIARACGAGSVEPGPMRVEGPRRADLARLAVDTFVEGCVGETTAALAMQRAAAGCESQALRAALLRIAGEEAQHAALAWETVSWAIAQGGERVRVALLRRAELLADELRSGGSERALDASSAAALAKLGRSSPAQLAQTQRDAWFGIVEPMLAQA